MFQLLWWFHLWGAETLTEGLKANLHLRAQTPASCDRRPCLCGPEEVRVCSLSICVLSGCGAARRSVQVNKIPPRAASLLIFLLFSLLCSPLVFPLPRLRPASPGPPVAQLQQRLGKADCGIPGKPLRVQSEGWGRASPHCIYCNLGSSFKKECVC